MIGASLSDFVTIFVHFFVSRFSIPFWIGADDDSTPPLFPRVGGEGRDADGGDVIVETIA